MGSWMAFNEGWLRSPKLAEYLKKAERAIASGFEDSHLMLLDDPRIARLLPFWNIAFQNLGISPHYLFLVQDPNSLAPELASGYGCNPPDAYLIWLRTMLDAEYHSRGYSRAFIDPTQTGEHPAQLLTTVVKELGLVFPRSIQSVYSSRDPSLKALRLQAMLKSQTASFGEDEFLVPPDWVKVAHMTLIDWAKEGEASEGRDLLDAVREAFDDAAPAFNGIGGVSGKMVQPTLEEKLAELERDLGHARAEISDARANEVAARQKAAQLKAEVDDAEAQLRERYAEIVTLSRKLADEVTAVEIFKRRTERLKLIALSFEDAGARGRRSDLLSKIMPWRWQVARIRKQMEDKGTFDGAAYLAANPDVGQAGMDPLKHYLRHGVDENRPLGLS